MRAARQDEWEAWELFEKFLRGTPGLEQPLPGLGFTPGVWDSPEMLSCLSRCWWRRTPARNPQTTRVLSRAWVYRLSRAHGCSPGERGSPRAAGQRGAPRSLCPLPRPGPGRAERCRWPQGEPPPPAPAPPAPPRRGALRRCRLWPPGGSGAPGSARGGGGGGAPRGGRSAAGGAGRGRRRRRDFKSRLFGAGCRRRDRAKGVRAGGGRQAGTERGEGRLGERRAGRGAAGLRDPGLVGRSLLLGAFKKRKGGEGQEETLH